MNETLAARIEAVRAQLRDAERAVRQIADDLDHHRADLDPLDRPVAVEVLDCLADMGLALGPVDDALHCAARHARLLP